MFFVKSIRKSQRFLQINRFKNSFCKVQVNFTPIDRIQFYIPKSCTVQQFKNMVEEHSKKKVDYLIENSNQNISDNNFLDTAILTNLTLKTGQKTLVYEIKKYQDKYYDMPTYDGDLLEQFQTMIPQNKPLSELKIQFKKPQSPRSLLKMLKLVKSQYLSWYQQQIAQIMNKSYKIPRIMMYGLAVQWGGMFGITYYLYDWNIAEPMVYITTLSIDLLLMMGYKGMEQSFQNSIERQKGELGKNLISDLDGEIRSMNAKLIYVSKKIDSL